MRAYVLASVVLLLPSFVLGQSLGDAAKKEQERRKAAQPKGGGAKVLTNEDLATTKGRLANDPAADSTASTATPDRKPETQTAGRDEPRPQAAGGSESEWRARASEARAQLRAAEEAAQQAEDSAARLGSAPEEGVEKTTVLKRRDAARARLAWAKRTLEELEEQARRDGVPPGWLRE